MPSFNIKQAAIRLDISENTVRRRLTNGLLPGHQAPTPQGFVWWVDLPDEPPDLEATADQDNHSGEVAALQELVSTLQGQLTQKDRQIEQLHILLQQSQEQANRLLPPPQQRRWWWPFS